MRHLTYFVAASLDGYIAGPEHEVDAFDFSPELAAYIVERYPETLPTPARTQLGLADAPNQRFDTVLMGRHTYDLGRRLNLISPYSHLEQIVVSTTLGAIDPAIRVITDPVAAIPSLKAIPGRGIWLCGGGTLAGRLIDAIDVLVIKRQPLVFGSGRPLLAAPYAGRRFEFRERDEVGSVVIETYLPRAQGGAARERGLG